jgi:hypothetical protein
MGVLAMFRFRVRKADIEGDLREKFELIGKDVVAFALGMFSMPVGPQSPAPTWAQREVWFHQDPAVRWLQEKRGEDARRETVTLALQLFAIFIAVVALVVSAISLDRGWAERGAAHPAGRGAWLNRLRHLRGPGESYSDVILRLAGQGG